MGEKADFGELSTGCGC